MLQLRAGKGGPGRADSGGRGLLEDPEGLVAQGVGVALPDQAVLHDRHGSGRAGHLEMRPHVAGILGVDRARQHLDSLDTALEGLVRSHRATQASEQLAVGPEWVDSDLVFTTRYGKPIDPDNFARSFHRLCARADLGHWTPHELRHSAASIMLAQGTPLWVVSEVLGHASIAITKDTYGHLLGAEKQEATEAITDALFEPDSGRREHR